MSKVALAAARCHRGASNPANLSVSEVTQARTGRRASIGWLHSKDRLKSVAVAAVLAAYCMKSRRVFNIFVNPCMNRWIYR